MTAALAYPFLHDQFINAAARGVGSPIAFYPYPVFNVEFSEPLRWLIDIPGFWLALLVIEFPAIYIPGAVSLIASLRVKMPPGSIAMTTKVFAALTVVSLLIAGFFTITFADNNDLGWRAVLPAVFILTIFAATGLSRWLTRPLSYTAAGALLLLLLGLPRSFQLVADNMRGAPSESGKAFAASPALWDAVRRHSGPAERIANNPQYLADMTPWPVNISWALFANRPSCFAGSDLALPYTSLPRARLEDIDDQFQRVFDGEGSTDDVRDLAMRYQCRVAVLTPRDGAWQRDPFAGSSYYTLAEEKPGAWKIYRATERSQALAARDGDADDFVVGDRLIVALRPGRRLGIIVRLHVERIDLASENGDHLDRHRHRPAEPAEPFAVGDDQFDLACPACARLSARCPKSRHCRRASASRSDRRPAPSAENGGPFWLPANRLPWLP